MATLIETRVSPYALQLTPDNLVALDTFGPLFPAKKAEFDRLTAIIQDVLECEAALLSIVEPDRQVFQSAQGLREPWATLSESSLSHSFCKHVVASGEPLVICDARTNPLVCDNPAIEELGAIAYLGVPIRTPHLKSIGSQSIGSLCALDAQPRQWTKRDLTILQGFSEIITSELALAQSNRAREKVVKSLEISQARYRTALSAARAGAWEWDIGQDRIIWSREVGELLGAEPDEYPATLADFVAMVAEDDRQRVFEEINRAIHNGGREFQIEFRIRNATGRQLKFVRSMGQVDRNEAGAPLRIVGLIFDIDELRRSQQLADVTEQIYQLTFANAPVGIARLDADGRFISVNRTLCAMMGRSEGELLATDFQSITYAGDLEKNLELRNRALAGVSRSYEMEKRFVRPDNTVIWAKLTSTRFDDPATGAPAFISAFADITEMKSAQEHVAVSEARLRRLIDNVFAFVGVLSLEGVLVEANNAPLEAAGLHRQDVIGLPFWECYWWSFAPESIAQLKTTIERACEGETVRYDVAVRVGDDQFITIDFQLAPVRDESGVIRELIASGVDISERVHVQKVQSLLLAELNHRVKNNLATVQAIASQTLRHSPKPRKFVESFSGRLKAMAKSNGLLTAQKWSGAPIRDVLADQLLYGTSTDAQINMSGPDAFLPPQVALSLGLVLHELGTNARKYGSLSTPQGKLDVVWSIQPESEKNVLKLTWIESGGPPVSPPQQKGFGATLIERSMQAGGSSDHVELKYLPGGVECRLDISISQIETPAWRKDDW